MAHHPHRSITRRCGWSGRPHAIVPFMDYGCGRVGNTHAYWIQIDKHRRVGRYTKLIVPQ